MPDHSEYVDWIIERHIEDLRKLREKVPPLTRADVREEIAKALRDELTDITEPEQARQFEEDAEPIEVGQVWTPWAQGASPRSYVVKWISGENVYMEPLVPLYTPCGFEEASRWTRCEIRNGWRRLPFERTRPKE